MAQECVHRVAAKSGIHFTSKSNPDGKGYRAYAFRDAPELPMCTCMPFLRGRSKQAKAEGVHPNEVAFTCGHLKILFAETCSWRQTTEAEYRYDDTCPECGSPVVETGDIPDFSDADAIADLLSMARDLRGDPDGEDAEALLAPAPEGGLTDVAAKLIAQARGNAA